MLLIASKRDHPSHSSPFNTYYALTRWMAMLEQSDGQERRASSLFLAFSSPLPQCWAQSWAALLLVMPFRCSGAGEAGQKTYSNPRDTRSRNTVIGPLARYMDCRTRDTYDQVTSCTSIIILLAQSGAPPSSSSEEVIPTSSPPGHHSTGGGERRLLGGARQIQRCGMC